MIYWFFIKKPALIKVFRQAVFIYTQKFFLQILKFKKMKPLLITAIAALLSVSNSTAQIKNTKTETLKVWGNCGMCKATIEKAAAAKNVSKAVWSEETKMAAITYDSKKTNADAILKKIALAGYDSEKFFAPAAAYNKLPDCCKYERAKKAIVKTPATAPAKDTAGMLGTTPPAKEVNELQAVYDNYFALKDALVKTDANTAAAKAGMFLASLNGVNMGKMKMDDHMAFMKVEKDLKMDAQHIAESKDTEHQRGHFMNLSKNIYPLFKTVKAADKVYLQHCPMYNNGKGADWLSKENAVKNPYYGAMMLTCGKTVETIQ
jgi:copper chaperone CopZ